jgi:hypothetical protein
MNLYSKYVPGGIDRVSLQGALDEGWVRGSAEGGDQEPNCGMEPTSLMVSPLPVLAVSMKVTDTVVLVGVAGDVVEGVVLNDKNGSDVMNEI